MEQSKMNLAKELLHKFSSENISQDDLTQADKKAGKLKEKMNDFKMLLSIFKDGIAGKYKISGSTLATIGGAIVYVVSPIDAIPDILPLVGWTDDAAIVGFVLNKLSNEIKKYKEFKKI